MNEILEKNCRCKASLEIVSLFTRGTGSISFLARAVQADESARKFSRLEHLFDASLLLLYFLLSPSVEAKKRRVVKVSGESGRGLIMQNYPVGQIGRSSFPSRIACCEPAKLDSIFRRILSAISTLSVIGS